MPAKIDHIVVGADTLEQGVTYLKNQLGVDIPAGGEHPKMGTHNCLMQLGDGVFFEIIAINPKMNPPDRPRWFGLDDPRIRQRLKDQPRLLTWVVNTRNLASLLKDAESNMGKSELLERGDLSWHFGLPADGSLLIDGVIPYAMQWHVEQHPSTRMADLGCRLRSLEIFHSNPDWCGKALGSIGADQLVKINALPENRTPFLQACISTPLGICSLRSDT